MVKDLIHSCGNRAGRLLVLAVVLVWGMSGCVTDPVTGGKKFSLLSRDQEIALGQQGDSQIVAQYGVYDDPAVASYVEGLGKSLAAKSEDPNYPYTFRVLNTPVVNAFALPGGWVYITRGLMAYLQDEAQLAVVMGHEIGHVNAHHTARQYSTQQLTSLGLGLASIFFEKARPFLGAAQTGLQLLFLANSRDDEREADELGVRYATKLGYQAGEASKFFETLQRIENQSQGGALPTWASTHPDPGERVANVQTLTAKYQQQYPSAQYTGTDPQQYLPHLNNMVFGENPRQGFVQGGVFYQPDLQIQFPVPSGWQVANFATQVQMAPSAGDAAIIMTAGGSADPTTAANQFIQGNNAQVTSGGPTTIGGFPAYQIQSNINVDDGNGGTAVLTALSAFIKKDNVLYVIHGYTNQAQFGTYASTFQSVESGFARVT
ncbi:MAG: M48 family metallopeptidase, partial [Bacteroidota bacterium]